MIFRGGKEVGGYVKLYRKIKNTSVWCDSDKLKLWIYCITEATHESRTILVGNQKIELKRGQFTTGRYKLEDDFNKGVKPKKRVDGSTLFRWLKLFEECGMLHIKSTNKYSIVTVVNWDKYQIDEQQTNNKCTSVEQQLNNSCTQYKNVKNVKNIKKEIYKEKKETYVSIVESYTKSEELRNALLEFVEMRKKMKGFTPRALHLALKNLDKLALDDLTKIDIVNQTIEHGWKTFYPLKDNKRVEDVPSWYADTAKTEADEDLKERIANLQEKLGKD